MKSATISLANAAGNSGLPTAGSFAAVELSPGVGAVLLDLRGTWAGTLIVQQSIDGINRTTLLNSGLTNLTDGAVTGLVSAGQGLWLLPVGGGGTVYVVASAWVSGSVTITLAAVDAGSLTSNIAQLHSDLVAAAGAALQTNPSIANATSVTILAASATRRVVELKNHSAVNIAFSRVGAVLTGIIPTAAVPCVVLTPGESWVNTSIQDVTQAFTAYQVSGAATELLSVGVN